MKSKLHQEGIRKDQGIKIETSCKSENQTSLKHKSYSVYSELARRTLFPDESTSSIKITHHVQSIQVIENRCIWEGTWLMNACWVSQCSSLKYSQQVCLKQSV